MVLTHYFLEDMKIIVHVDILLSMTGNGNSTSQISHTMMDSGVVFKTMKIAYTSELEVKCFGKTLSLHEQCHDGDDPDPIQVQPCNYYPWDENRNGFNEIYSRSYLNICNDERYELGFSVDMQIL